LTLAVCLFFRRFLDPFFSLNIAIFDENGFQNGAKIWSAGAYFSENMQKRKSVFGLRRRVRIAYEPIQRSAQGHPKIKEKHSLFQKMFFEGANTKICEHMVPKCLQKGEFISVVSPFGRSWHTFGVRSPFLTKKVRPKSSENVPRDQQ